MKLWPLYKPRPLETCTLLGKGLYPEICRVCISVVVELYSLSANIFLVMDSPARRSQLRQAGGVALELRESEASLTSRANSPYTDLESNYGCGDSISNDGWNQPSIERCMSCISKLGKHLLNENLFLES